MGTPQRPWSLDVPPQRIGSMCELPNYPCSLYVLPDGPGVRMYSLAAPGVCVHSPATPEVGVYSPTKLEPGCTPPDAPGVCETPPSAWSLLLRWRRRCQEILFTPVPRSQHNQLSGKSINVWNKMMYLLKLINVLLAYTPHPPVSYL